MFSISVNDKKNIYRSKPVMNVDTTGSSGSIPKPLTYDYMPEGYPKKDIEYVTLMEEQEVAFSEFSGLMVAVSPVALAIKQGDKLTVLWDGVSYDVVVKERVVPGPDNLVAKTFGNLALINKGESKDYPFVYVMAGSMVQWGTADTATSHTIKVMRQQETITPMSADYMPEDYPKKDGWSIEWDGNTEGKVTVEGTQLCKFSDMVLSVDDLLGAMATVPDNPEMNRSLHTDDIQQISEGLISVRIFDGVFIVKKDNVYWSGLTFPEKGVYTMASNPKFKMYKETITPMSTDFMPKNLNVVFRGELEHAPTSCNVTYNELRDWVERDIPVFAVFITANAKFNITSISLLTDSLGFVYFINDSTSRSFVYKSDGTFVTQPNDS